MNQILHSSHVSRMISENRKPNLICVQEILQDKKKNKLSSQIFFAATQTFICLLQLRMYINCENYW